VYSEIVDFVSSKLNIKQKDLLEKDLILHRVLIDLSKNNVFFNNYAFKGGTCLTKCYFGYYRFSEDLDFTYIGLNEFKGMSNKKIRKEVSVRINFVAKILKSISDEIGLDFRILKGNNKYFEYGGNNTFVTFKLWYFSKELQKNTFIKIQINYLEIFKFDIKECSAKSLLDSNLKEEFLINFSDDYSVLFSTVSIKCYGVNEILLEKVRAILTRKGVKGRDFVDLFLISKKKGICISDFKKEIKDKIVFALKYEKYSVNLLEKDLSFLGSFILGDEERLMIKPLPSGFKIFLKNMDCFLEELIKEF
jgi:predicted nucleotidyltransferase component of viral defense system